MLRVMDSFDMLNGMSDVDAFPNASGFGVVSIESTVRQAIDKIDRLAFPTTATVRADAVRNAEPFASMKRAGIDVVDVFDEDETAEISIGRLVYGVTLLHVLSKDAETRVFPDEKSSHEIAWMSLVNASGVPTASAEGAFSVPTSDVRMWIEAAACLGVVRGKEYLSRGGLLSAMSCADRLFTRWCRDADVGSNASIGKDQFDRLLDHVEYNMFWNRNTTPFTAIEYARKKERVLRHMKSREGTDARAP